MDAKYTLCEPFLAIQRGLGEGDGSIWLRGDTGERIGWGGETQGLCVGVSVHVHLGCYIGVWKSTSVGLNSTSPIFNIWSMIEMRPRGMSRGGIAALPHRLWCIYSVQPRSVSIPGVTEHRGCQYSTDTSHAHVCTLHCSYPQQPSVQVDTMYLSYCVDLVLDYGSITCQERLI
jgi:hypothetical protein